MLRQRIRARTSRLGWLGLVPVLLLALILIWYGLMCVLLAVKVSPSTVNGISGYRSVFDALAGAGPLVSPTARAIAAGAGLLAFVVFGLLLLAQIPRPYLARGELDLEPSEGGRTTVEPRAVERLAEAAAIGHDAVSGVHARYGTEDLAVLVSLRRADGLPAALAEVRQRVHSAISTHGLPDLPVNVTLDGFDRQHGRELN